MLLRRGRRRLRAQAQPIRRWRMTRLVTHSRDMGAGAPSGTREGGIPPTGAGTTTGRGGAIPGGGRTDGPGSRGAAGGTTRAGEARLGAG
eukprot:5059132-Prorocentrum_lima.AAC.1